MVDVRLPGASPAVVDGLGAVAVRVEQEGAVVPLVILGSPTWFPIARIARVNARSPERVDLRFGRRHERDMEPARQRVLIRGGRGREVAPVVAQLAAPARVTE